MRMLAHAKFVKSIRVEAFFPFDKRFAPCHWSKGKFVKSIRNRNLLCFEEVRDLECGTRMRVLLSRVVAFSFRKVFFPDIIVNGSRSETIFKREKEDEFWRRRFRNRKILDGDVQRFMK